MSIQKSGASLIQEANAKFQDGLGKVKDSIPDFISSGELLEAAKKQIPHGRFESEVATNWHFGMRQAQRCMMAFRNRDQIADQRSLRGAMLALTGPRDDPGSDDQTDSVQSSVSKTTRASLLEIRHRLVEAAIPNGASILEAIDDALFGLDEQPDDWTDSSFGDQLRQSVEADGVMMTDGEFADELEAVARDILPALDAGYAWIQEHTYASSREEAQGFFVTYLALLDSPSREIRDGRPRLAEWNYGKPGLFQRGQCDFSMAPKRRPNQAFEEEISMSENQVVSAEELSAIRGLEDFDLTMLISEIHDHGWPMARRTLAVMLQALAKVKARESEEPDDA